MQRLQFNETMTSNSLRKVRSLEYVLRASVSARSGTSPGKTSRSCNNLQAVSEIDASENEIPTCLTKTNLFQGSMLMIGIMTLLNVLIKSCILAFVAPTVTTDVSELDVYGLLSTEVVIPLSMLIQPNSGSKAKQKRRMKRTKKLGSTAISSIIDFVGPVLPFAGGVDLRRLHPLEVYEWIKSLVCHDAGSFQGVMARSRSSSAIVSSLNVTYSKQDLKLQDSAVVQGRKCISDKNRPLVLGASDPFVPLEDIAELNLEEVALAFHLSRHEDLTAANVSSIRKQMHNVANAVQGAAAVTRGEGVQSAAASGSFTNGNIDASLFCAALRIFAEWRMLRTVPEGYKSYSVGMALGLKDVVQNIAKVEVIIREWVEIKCLQMNDGNVLRGPTVRQLLEYELDIGLHPNIPRLNGGAAIGLLWSLRQLLYQSAVFQNILDTPNKFPDTKTAVGAAYTQIYGKYHGWAVQKIFNYSFRSAPDTSLIFNMMDTNKLREFTEGVGRDRTILECEENDSMVTRDTELSLSFDSGDDAAEDVAGRLVAELAFWDAAVNATENKGLGITAEHLNLDNKEGNGWLGNLIHHAAKIVEHIDHEFSKVGEKLLESQRLLANWGDVKALEPDVLEENADVKNHIRIISEVTQSTCSYSSGVAIESPEFEMYISQKMEGHIRHQITSYLNLMKPITIDIEELFNELNMNDPSKV